jgi:nucleoid-associated protein YgaU
VPSQAGIITTTSREVVVDVVVRDGHGHLVKDVDASEFQVYEDGVKQRITSFRNIQGQQQADEEQVATRPQPAAATVNSGAIAASSLREMHFVKIVVGHCQTGPLDGTTNAWPCRSIAI